MSDCIEWLGARTKGGYGAVKVAGVVHRVHRRAWEIANGPIAKGLFVCHHCDNRACFNVAHLFLGTAADNNADRDRKGRRADQSFEKGASARLALDDVHEMRVAFRLGANQRDLADLFGVSPAAVSMIVNGKNWISPPTERLK